MDTTVVHTDVAGRVRAARLARQWSQRRLAERIGVATTTIVNIERGYTQCPNGAIVRHLAETLGVSADWLLGVGEGETHER